MFPVFASFLQNFTVYLGNESDVSEDPNGYLGFTHECAYHDGPIPSASNETIFCYEPRKVAQFLYIHNPWDPQMFFAWPWWLIVLCEVVIQGFLPIGKCCLLYKKIVFIIYNTPTMLVCVRVCLSVFFSLSFSFSLFLSLSVHWQLFIVTIINV